MAKPKDSKNLHKEHRERVRKRFLKHGFGTFDDHVILEALLYYTIPRKDTNPLAHILINRFGSLNGVFNASYDELISVEGVGDSTATFILMLRSLITIFNGNAIDQAKLLLSVDALGEMAASALIGEPKESVMLMYIKNKRVINTKILSKGGTRDVMFDRSEMIRKALETSCDMIAVAHNHPDGSVTPSVDDYRTYYNLNTLVENMKLRLFEFFIVSGDEYYPLIASGDVAKQENK